MKKCNTKNVKGALHTLSQTVKHIVNHCPPTFTWPHMRCDVGLEERKYKYSLCDSIVYYYNGAQRYEQFLQVGRLYRALILLVSSVLMVLYTLCSKAKRDHIFDDTFK